MILILNGSPNKNSKTMDVTNSLLANKNEEIVILNTYDLFIYSCDDCKYCDNVIGCSKKDDMDQIYQLLIKANTFIISSPIYFGVLTDSMMKVINRFQRYYSEKFIHNTNVPTFDNFILVCTQGSEKQWMFDGAKTTFKILQRLFHPIYTNSILIPSSDNTPLLTKIDRDNIEETSKNML